MVSAAGICEEAQSLVLAGQPRRAETLLRGLLLDDIRFARAYRLLSHAAHAQGRRLEAAALAHHAISLEPRTPENHFMLGVVQMGRHDHAAAVEAFQAAVEIDPSLAEAHLNLGNMLTALEDYDRAVEHYHRALKLRSAMPEGHLNLGACLRSQRDFAGAEAAVRQALELKPGMAGAYLNLGNALTEQARFGEAAEAYRAHLAASPDDAATWLSLGAVLACLGMREDSMAAYDRAVELAPDDKTKLFERASAKLLLGDFETGWADYEYRWTTDKLKAERPNLPGREWQGEDLAGKTLFVFGEQGYGDNIQFLRYLPILVEQGARVIFCSDWRMKELTASLSPKVEWYGGQGAPLPAYDYFAALLSLPCHLKTGAATIPVGVPYLSIAKERQKAMKAVIEELAPGPGLRVGLVWSGRPTHGNDAERSLEPEDLGPLLAVEGVRFFSLQQSPRDGHLERLGKLGTVHDLSAHLTDFADTGAALQALDLLVSVDTAVAHLAGALNRPAWVMITRQPDWRWLLEREDSPWYPSLKLFRQSGKWDWRPVVERLWDELGAMAKRQGQAKAQPRPRKKHKENS